MQKKRGQFSIDIIHCDGFVSMPATAQALYFQILASCDDEGFTSQLGMCKYMAHASDKDVETLVERKFIYRIGSNNRVTVVKHWRMNAWLNPNRADKSTFAERSLIFVKPNGNYTLDASEGTPLDQSNVNQVSDKCQSDVSQMSDKCQPRAGVRSPSQSNPYQSIPIHTNKGKALGKGGVTSGDPSTHVKEEADDDLF